MTMEDNNQAFYDANRAMWDEYAHINYKSEMYGMKEFRTTKNKLNPLELGEVGAVAGKSLLHLQCHFGMDTLSWAHLGAQVTGVDFSPEAIGIARKLSADLKLSGRFICCPLFDLPQHLDEQFDIVYTSYGVLTWLDDIRKWGQLVARYLKPGGMFYIAEFHPFAMMFDDAGDEFRLRYSYFDSTPQEFKVEGSYADKTAQTCQKVDYEWMHTMGDIVSAIAGAGLRIEFMHEFTQTVYEQFPFVRKVDKHYWAAPEGSPDVPLMFSIKAWKDR